ncbi:MAG: hypothetical protein DCF16_18540 [Alphaproteobacteria bacterium]|nr:MAG: hypothetical protein DCF16_18540 [Alphaproteobacteria bacterium]
MVLGSAAAPLLGDTKRSSDPDPVAQASDAWLARRAEHERLGRRWQQIESRLFREHNWPRLSRVERKRFPEKHEMDDLYDRMDALHEENRNLLTSLPALVATSPLGICGKLAIAAIEVCPEENEEAHRLISSILRDYRALHGG